MTCPWFKGLKREHNPNDNYITNYFIITSAPKQVDWAVVSP